MRISLIADDTLVHLDHVVGERLELVARLDVEAVAELATLSSDQDWLASVTAHLPDQRN